MIYRKIELGFLYFFVFIVVCSTGFAGKIVYPWHSTTAIVKTGESFEVWFDADSGQTVNSVELDGPYNKVNTTKAISTGDWVYDPMSGNRYNTRITVTVPAAAPADRYDLILNTSCGQAVSGGAVKVIRDYKTRYKILHISDTHLGQGKIPKGLTEAKLTAIVDMSNMINPEMVFVTGDNITWTARDFQDRVNLFFEGDHAAGVKGLRDMNAASFVVAGNHDYTEGIEDRSGFFKSKATFWNTYYGLQNYDFKYGNTRCLMFNDGWNDSNYNDQLTDLANWLSGEGAGGKLRLMACHIARRETMGPFAHDNNIGLALVGHNHHLGKKNPYKLDDRFSLYYALSVREYCEFNLFQVDDSTGNYTAMGYANTDPNSDSYGRATGCCRVLQNDDRKNNPDTSVWKYNLTLVYANNNDGTASCNTATLVNKFDFPIPDARVRFVMPKGPVYAVSTGTIEQQFDGDAYRIVDVSIDLNPNSTTTAGIAPVDIPAALRPLSGMGARGDD